MKTIRRLTSSISSSFHWVVNQIENHEALVDAAIKEVQDAEARARVQLKRLQADGAAQRKQLAGHREQERIWLERGKRLAEADQTTAIECLKRRRKCAEQVRALEVQEREHSLIEQQLSQDLEAIRGRLNALRQQRNLMRTRQSRAEALTALNTDDGRLLTELDDLFERWEVKIAQCESIGGINPDHVDPVEHALADEEEANALRAELEALLSADTPQNSTK